MSHKGAVFEIQWLSGSAQRWVSFGVRGWLIVTYILQYSSGECGVRDSLFGNTFYAAQNN